MSPVLKRLLALALGLLASRIVAPLWCGRDAGALYRGDPAIQDALAAELVAFEARDDGQREPGTGTSRYAGEWALVTHQMVALGLAQICEARPARCPALIPTITDAAKKTFQEEMRDFGTRAWEGEDALDSLDGAHGHAYMAYDADPGNPTNTSVQVFNPWGATSAASNPGYVAPFAADLAQIVGVTGFEVYMFGIA